MHIKMGDHLPELAVWRVTNSGSTKENLLAWLGAGKNIIFTLPGAYTPTCHVHHLPGYIAAYDAFKTRGVNNIVCASVNDHFVMRAWAESHAALGKIEFLADFDAKLAEQLGLAKDLSAGGLGKRFQRTAIIVENGLIQAIFVDDKPGQLTFTGAQAILDVIDS